MKIDFEGRTWQLDTADISMSQALAITAYTGTSLTAWEKAYLNADDPVWLKALRGLYWLMREQNSEPVPIDEAEFAVIRFYAACAKALEAEAGEAKAAAEADPTKSGGVPAGEPAAPPAESPAG